MNACDRLPALEPLDVRRGRPVRLRAPELGSTVVFLPHGGRCDECERLLQALVEAGVMFSRWDARLIVVAPDDDAEAAPVMAERLGQPHVSVVADPDGAIARRLDVSGGAELLIADRFGECFHAARAVAGDHEALPGAEEVEEWLRLLATQCPECGVPDTAGDGGWKVEG